MTWPRVILTAPVLPLVLWMLGAAPHGVQLPQAPPSERDSTASSEPANRTTDAPPPASAEGPVPEYATVVAPIVARHCTACHRAGGVAPFDLESPEALARRAATIARSVREGEMPPWFARAADATHVFANDPSLSAGDKAALLRWLESADRPLGDLAKAPPPRGPAPEWRIGAPDLVVELPRSVEVPAAGTMPYVNLRVPLGLAADAWVRAWEVSPTAREVVHHVLVFAVPEGARGPAEEARGFFSAYVPGGGMRVYDDTRAKRLPKGSDLLFQLHYTPNGRATSDRTRIALRFADGPPQREVRTAGIFDARLDIPPNAAAHVEGTRFTVPADLRVLSWMPHMHMRGSAFRAFRLAPDGTRVPLLDIPRYDFNWQLSYDYATPLEFKRGTVIGIEGVFDNSTANPANPDASQRVRWGQQTTDEMLIGYVEYELVGAGAAPQRRGRRLVR